jgi:lipopolysaccharide assembly outer membrane protein LptD (OstA)
MRAKLNKERFPVLYAPDIFVPFPSAAAGFLFPVTCSL